MTPEQFCYWLQGYFEIQGIGTKDDMEGVHPDQAKIIRDHLNLVFDKKTPQRQVAPPPLPTSRGGGLRYCGAPPPARSISMLDLTEEVKELEIAVSC